MTKGKILFTGSFWEYLGTSIALLILSALTFGIFFPYYVYWSAKYFANHLEIELYAHALPADTPNG